MLRLAIDWLTGKDYERAKARAIGPGRPALNYADLDRNAAAAQRALPTLRRANARIQRLAAGVR